MNLQSVKKILKKIFFLPPVQTLLFSIPSYGLVIYALSGKDVNPVVAYVSYFLSAYAFVITITGATSVAGWMRQGIEQHPFVRMLLGIPMVGRYFREDMFRAEAALYQGFVVNFLYAGIKMFSGIYYGSMFRQIMTASTGAGVSIIVLGMATFMIVCSTKKLNQN